MLKMTPAREQDRGLYSCLASNEAGEARRDFSVEVLGRTHLRVLLLLGASRAELGRAPISLLHRSLCSGGWRDGSGNKAYVVQV